MNQIYFLSWMSDSVERQIKELEKLLDFKMHVGYPSTTEKEMEHQIRWAEKNGMVAIICNLTQYETVMDHRPMIPVYPVELRYYDTCVILQLLKRDLKKKNLPYRKVILGTALPITVRLDMLEEMFDLELYNPPWPEKPTLEFFKELASEGYEVVVCSSLDMNMIRQAGMYPFHDESANDYIVFVNDIKATIQQVVVGNELQNALKSMRNMMNYSFEAICILDRYGRITAFNELAEKMFDGSKTKEFYGKYFWEMVLEVAEEDVKDVVEKGQGFYSRMIKIGDQMGLMNIMPSSREKEANGAVVHFMTLQQIDNLEAQVKNEYYKKGHYAKYTFKDITGTSASMMKTMRLAKRFAGYQSNVLLYGESGCGKELFAQSIHNDSMRANQPFVAINAGSLPTNLLESELFGYVEGAFTGASKKGKKGLFEIANKGTIFLDEISEIDAQGQTRLLRVLEERCVMRIGDDKIIPVDVRVIAASNKSLAKLVQEGKFREDLYYRLNVLTLNIPPLRERGEDALLIADRYLEYYGRKFHKQVFLSEGAKHAILQCPWKGNVRQLRNFCEYLVVVADQPEISEQEVWEQLQATEMAVYDDRTATEKNSTNEMKIKVPEKNGFKPPISSRSITAEDIQMALDVAEGKKDKTAALLGISKATLWRKMKQFHME